MLAFLALFSSAASQGTCTQPQFASLPFCDSRLSTALRVADLISRLNATEKFVLFSSWDGAHGVPALGIPGYQWWSEGEAFPIRSMPNYTLTFSSFFSALHGLAHSPGVHFHGKTTYATSFPQVCMSAMSYNASAWHMIAMAIATEGRAFNNQNDAGVRGSRFLDPERLGC